MDSSFSLPEISNQDLYAMVLKLTDRCVQVETALANLTVAKISGPPNLMETDETYFGKRANPVHRFNMLNTIITIIDEDITNLFDTTFRETLSNLLRRNMYTWMESDNCPIHVFRKKLYVYDYDYDKINDEDTITKHFPKWRVCNLPELTYLLNHIQKIILSKLMNWKVKQDSIRVSADVCDLMYQKALQKILKIDFKSPTTITTIRAMISKICMEWIDYE